VPVNAAGQGPHGDIGLPEPQEKGLCRVVRSRNLSSSWLWKFGFPLLAWPWGTLQKNFQVIICFPV